MQLGHILIKTSAVVFAVLCMASRCPADDPVINTDDVTVNEDTAVNTPPHDDAVINITAHPEDPGYGISDDFLGLSIEENALVPDPKSVGYQFDPYNPVIQQLFMQLAPAHIRFGGNSIDEFTGWTRGQRTTASPTDVLYSSDVDAAMGFARKVGWKVLWGLGMGKMDVATDANQAGYVYQVGWDVLQGFEIGNEPNLYKKKFRPAAYSVSDYINEWRERAAAVKAVTNGKMLAGAAVTLGSLDTWTTVIASRLGSQLGLLTQHAYPLDHATTAGPRAPTIANLLSDFTRRKYEAFYASQLREIVEPLRIEWRMAETNACNGGGQEGVSDGFASALWGLDYMFTLATYQSSGVDFHTGRMGGYSGSPIKVWHGVVTAQPLYYAMLMFRQAARGHLIPLDLSAHKTNLTAYAALDNDKVLRVTVINKDAQQVAIVITPGADYHAATIMRLQGQSLNSGDGVTLDGSSVDARGVWNPTQSYRQITQFNHNFLTTIPAGSAMLVTFRSSN